MAHVFLLLFVPAENPNFGDIALKKAPDDRVAEGSGAASDEKCFVFEHGGY
jgi:hypothetical protein